MLLAPIAAAAATGFGSAAGGGIMSAIFGGGGQQQQQGTNWSAVMPLYAAQMGAMQSQITGAQQAAAIAGGAEAGALGAEAKLAADTQLTGYSTKLAQEQAAKGLETGIAAQYAEAVTGLEGKTGEAKLALALTPAETQKSLAETYGQAVSAIGKETAGKMGELGTGALAAGGTILGQGVAGAAKALDSASLAELYKPAATATAEAAAQTVAGQNKAVSDILTTNLRIAEQQEATRNQIALQRAQVEGQLALKRFGRGAALAGKAAVA